MSPFVNIHKILIIRCGALGDLIYSTSIIDALQKEYGETIQIDWVTTPGLAGFFNNDIRVHKTFALKHRKLPIFLSMQKKAIIKTSKQSPYDLAINLEQSPYFDALFNAIFARHKVGSPCTLPQQPPISKHMVDIIKSMYAPAVNSKNLLQAKVKIIGNPIDILEQKYNLPPKYLVFAPSNSHTKRNKINYRAWPATSWKSLINNMPENIPIVIISGKMEAKYLEELKPYPPNVIDLSGKTPLLDLITIIQGAQAVLTTDTGPAHLASAVETPVYALIGPTPHERTGPYQGANNFVKIISVNIDCAPCYGSAQMKACKNNICMSQISPQHVLITLQNTIERFNS